jgi:minor extracellular serine protease Vpr
MRIRSLLCAILSILLCLFPMLSFAQVKQIHRIDPEFLSSLSQGQDWKRVLIEFGDDPAIEHLEKHHPEATATEMNQMMCQLKSYQNQLAHKQEHFFDWASRQDIKLIADQAVFLVLNAIYAEVKSADIPKLLSYSNIKYIHEDKIILRPIRHSMAKSTRTTEAWKGMPRLNLPPLTGEKQLIGVIDTGLDVKHDEFAKGKKIRGGYNFADNNSDFSDSGYHGTHVAGIACGDGSSQDSKGMSYSSDIMVYRVFSNRFEGGRNVIAAIDKAVADRCSVINLSLGSNSDEPSKGSSPYHRSIANADKVGSFVVAGAGNSASRCKEIPWPIITPSIVEEAFCVAGSDDRKQETLFTVLPQKGKERKLKANHIYPTPLFTNTQLAKGLVYGGYGKPEELEALDLQGKIALIQRGPGVDGISFRDKVDNAMLFGASGVILYNNTPGEIILPVLLKDKENPEQLKKLVPTAMLNMEDGLYLKNLLLHEFLVQVNYVHLSVIADFSSMGLSGDASFKPEITAPSTRIMSTVPFNSYAEASGTSMATPCISGLAALVKQGRPKWNHSQIKSAFMNTADIMLNPLTGLPIPFVLQGAGSVRLDKALDTPAFIEPRALVFSKSPEKITHQIQISNARNEKQTFKLSSEIFHLSHENSPISISFSQNEITIEANRKATFTATFELDKKAFAQHRYDGIIRIGNDLHLPMIFFRDSAQTIEEAISNLRLSKTKIVLTSQEPINISFSLNSGRMTSYHEKDIFYSGSNYGDIHVSIIDRKGEVWADLPSMYGLMVGEYNILWDGKNAQNRYFLPNGDFAVQLRMEKYEYKNNQLEIKNYHTIRQTFSIIESTIPEAVESIMFCQKQYQVKNELKLGIRFNELSSMLALKTQIGSIELQIRYDSKRLMYRSYLAKNWLIDDQGTKGLIVDADDHNGFIRISINCSELSPEHLSLLPFLEFTFRTVETGRILFQSKTSFFHLENGTSIKINSSLPVARIVNTPFLLSDLNNDNIVNQRDMVIFSKAFRSKKGEENYNELCDFNQDELVDMLDFLIISKEIQLSL